MTPLADALRDPIPLAPNRIPRFYRGGRLLGAFRGLPQATDDDRPEDWVGSATSTWHPPGADGPAAGVSTVEIGGRRHRLDDVLRAEPEAVTGAAPLEGAVPTLGVLVKLLDAAERLPVHCHPTRADAARLLGSPFGKTEAWIVLGVRDDNREHTVWAGFREPVAPSTLREWIESGDAGALLEALVAYTVAPGDVFLIPGGVPHAIGAGTFILEVQEPTDFSVVAETRGFPIRADDASLGLGWDRAIQFFRTDAPGDLRQPPGRPAEHDGLRLTPLLGPAADPYFRAVRVEVTGREVALPIDPRFAVGIVVGGSGTLDGPTRSLPLTRGVTFALAATAVPEARCTAQRPLEIILCLPADPALGRPQ
jgi:mannose-6-phosphate isomerase